MLFQSAYKSVGQVVLSLITWAVLIQDWRVAVFDGRIGEYRSVFRNTEENWLHNLKETLLGRLMDERSLVPRLFEEQSQIFL